MSTRSVDESRIRKRIAEIDQHISVLLKERDELLFAERVLERLRDEASEPIPQPRPIEPVQSFVPAPAPAPSFAPTPSYTPAAPVVADQPESDSIEEALLKLESQQFSMQR